MATVVTLTNQSMLVNAESCILDNKDYGSDCAAQVYKGVFRI